MSSPDIAFQTHLERAGVDTLDDGQDGLEGHFLNDLLLSYANSEFSGPGQEQQVGRAHSIYSCDEGDGDAFADFVDVLEVLHDLNEAEHSADDADGGSKSCGSFKDFGDARVIFATVVKLQLHHPAEVGSADAVNGEHEAFFEEGILNSGQLSIEREDAFLAGFIGIVEKVFNEFVGLGFTVHEDVFQVDGGLDDDLKGKLHHDGADGAANHDKSRSRLKNLGNPAAFKHQTKSNSEERNQYAAKGTFVHSTPVP